MEENQKNLNEKTNSTVVLEEKVNNIEIQEEVFPEKKEKSKTKLILIIAIILILFIALFSTIFAIVNIGSEKIIKGINIAQIDISNKTKEQAKAMLEEIYLPKDENEIYFTYKEFESTSTYKTLEVEYQIEKAINQAYDIGRSGNLLKDNFDILKSLIKGNQIELEVTIDTDMINQVIENINNSIDGAVVQPSYYIEGEKLIVTSGKQGLKVQEKELIEEIYKVVKYDTQTQKITIPLITAQPEEINIEKIYEEVYKEAKDAYYTTEPFMIYPETNGISFEIENAKTIIAEEKEEYEIPLIITKPAKRTKDLGKEAFPELIATYSTKYNPGLVDRTTNLRIAANKINGTVLLPNEEFSYNKIVGKRTAEAGFKKAAVYSGGKVVDGIGGGICQITSTLYDAVVIANLNVTVRRNHQFVPGYSGAGKDATVVWGAQDFKFINSRKYPVRITATVEGGTATVQVWGKKEDVEYDITIETKKTATIPYTTEYIKDETLPAGQQVVEQEGNNGRKVEAYKVTRLNGNVVSTTLLSKDTYNAMKKIVRVGTAQQ